MIYTVTSEPLSLSFSFSSTPSGPILVSSSPFILITSFSSSMFCILLSIAEPFILSSSGEAALRVLWRNQTLDLVNSIVMEFPDFFLMNSITSTISETLILRNNIVQLIPKNFVVKLNINSLAEIEKTILFINSIQGEMSVSEYTIDAGHNG